MKRKQSPCKPGPVPLAGCLSFIYSAGYPTALAFYPPSWLAPRTDSPQPMVYANLQPPDGTARRSPAGWWSLTPPSHPYPRMGGHSLLPYPTVTNSWHFHQWSVLCCPDFPLVPHGHQRQTVALLSACKGTKKSLILILFHKIFVPLHPIYNKVYGISK